jgi:lysophospholipase L1-like esterase
MRAALVAAALAALLPAAPALAAPTGMVEQPCPPPLLVPPSVAKFNAAFLEPGKPDLARMIALTKEPDYVAHEAARKARDAQDPNGLCRYAQANAELLATGRRPEVVFFGDSITENWVPGDPDLFADGRIVGRGIGGQTSAQMLVRFHADVVRLRPRVVHIMAGTNDVAGNGGLTSEAAYHANIEAMVEIARAHRVRVVLASLPPAARFFWRPELRPAAQIQRLNIWLRSYARREGLRFIDYHGGLSAADGGMRPEFAIDGVHPNRDGYTAMRELALDAFDGK